MTMTGNGTGTGNGLPHLRVRSHFSIVDSLIKPEELPRIAAERDIPAVALTDYCTLSAQLKFCGAAIQQGIKPIVGVEQVFQLADPELARAFATRDEVTGSLVLLAMNQTGYQNLCQLSTHARPYVSTDVFVQHPELSEGLIAMSGGRSGLLAKAVSLGDEKIVTSVLELLSQPFLKDDRFYLEIHAHEREGDAQIRNASLRLAQQNSLPLVGNCDVRFINESDFYSHDLRCKIITGENIHSRGRQLNSSRQYLMNSDELYESYVAKNIAFEALDNAKQIAKRCNFSLEKSKTFSMPQYQKPDAVGEVIDATTSLKNDVKLGLQKHLQAEESEWPAVYRDRVEYELSVISNMKYEGYFLIVADFIQWAKDQGIPVGPGRGSAAGSIIAWSLGITDVDPIKYGLLFERFLNPERMSMPDIDVDLCTRGRDSVIEYVRERYGRDCVAQIGTVGTLGAKAVLRTMAKVLGKPIIVGDRLARMVPTVLDIKLAEAYEQSDDLNTAINEDTEMRELYDLSLSVEGVVRSTAKHAAGVVISDTSLSETVPLWYDPNSDSDICITQFDGTDIEYLGLVKFDFLGVSAVTLVDDCVALYNELGYSKAPLQQSDIDVDDPHLYALIKAGLTTGLFQLEGQNMQSTIRQFAAGNFSELAALSALIRPGFMGSRDEDGQSNFQKLLDKKSQGDATAFHPALQDVLKETWGFFIYQEQVMNASRVMAGYTLAQADELRRAIGKKSVTDIDRHRKIFVEGAQELGHDRATAEYVYNYMEPFGSYGFNKSHAVSYAFLTAWSAWFKAHHPDVFFSAIMSLECENGTPKWPRMYRFYCECRQLGVKLSAPHINASNHACTVVKGQGRVQLGLCVMRNLPKNFALAVEHERKQSGDFSDLEDLCCRLPVEYQRSNSLRILIRGGACDGFGVDRAELEKQLSTALAKAAHIREHEKQNDLFAMGPNTQEDNQSQSQQHYDKVHISHAQLDLEERIVGYVASRDVLVDARHEWRGLSVTDIATLQAEEHDHNECTVAGRIVDAALVNGSWRVWLDDHTAALNFQNARWPEQSKGVPSILALDGSEPAKDFAALAATKAQVVCHIKKSRQFRGSDAPSSWNITNLYSLHQVRLERATAARINLTEADNKLLEDSATLVSKLTSLSAAAVSQPKVPIELHIHVEGNVYRVQLPATCCCPISEAGLDYLRNEFINSQVFFQYSGL